MGLIKAIAGAAGGVLSDQWKEYFYCEAIPADVLVVKGQKRVSGRSSNRGADNIISDGSVIAVADGQCMIIVEQGKVVDICAEPGEYTYDIFGRVTSHKKMMTFIYPTTAKAYESTTYSYDLAGNLVKLVYASDYSAVQDPTIMGIADHTAYYYYDLSGNLLSISEDYGKGAKTQQTFTYDLFGRISRHQVLNLWEYHYAYDANGNILSETRYSAEGKLEAITTFSYIPVKVSRKDAERLLAQQESIYHFLFKSYPPNPMPEGEQFSP